jgi:hypothetical protein
MGFALLLSTEMNALIVCCQDMGESKPINRERFNVFPIQVI